MNKWLAGGGATFIVFLCTALWNLSGETADTKRRVDTVEKRQSEDRTETKQATEKLDAKADRIDKNVQEIRILLEGMKERKQR